MTTSKLRRCRDLTAVSRLVGSFKHFSRPMSLLRRTKAHDQHYLLSSPATLALAIEETSIDLTASDPIRVLLFNPSLYELVDRGQWFRFVPAMLGAKRPIEITIADPNNVRKMRSNANEALYNSQRVPVRILSKSPQVVLANAPESFDLAISFSPLPLDDFSSIHALLKTLQRSYTPLFFSSFSSLHALLNHTVLRAFSLSPEAVVSASPFSLVSKRSGENWNRVLSKLTPARLTMLSDTIDSGYVDALPVVSQMVLWSHKLGDASQVYPVGGPVEEDWVHLLDGMAINKTTFELKNLDSGDVIGGLPALAELVEDYDDTWNEVDRLVWASHLRYLAFSEGIQLTRDKQVA